MSTMQNLLEEQNRIKSDIQKLLINFKKAGERRTPEYIKKQLENLEVHWDEYQHNHIQLCGFCDENHPYIAQNEYDPVNNSYVTTKKFISNYQQQQEETTKEKTSQDPPKPHASNQLVSGPSPTPRKVVESGTNSKLDEMLRKQSSNFRAFRRTISSFNLESMNEKWELEDFLRTLQTRWSVIDNLHWDLDSELEGTNEAYEQEFSRNESIFNEVKKSINSKIWSVANREYSTPKMDIPIFYGNYHQWVPFKDLFTEAIHNNRSLSKAQKLQFLKSKVKGEAERLIQHLQISSDNYSVCWDILNQRYNNPKLIFTSHINIVMSLPSSQQVSSSHIKKIHDSAQESLNAIKNLGVDISTWDPLIVHILSQKLDSDTHNDYIQSLKCPRELPKLKDFLDFLELKFISLEASRKKLENTYQTKTNIQQNNTYTKIPRASTYTYKQSYASNRFPTQVPIIPSTSKNFNNTKYQCPLCGSDHGIYFCKQFLDMAPYMKRKTVAKLNLCCNCLFQHNGKVCISDKRCRKCNGIHNTILHEAYGNASHLTPAGVTPARLPTGPEQSRTNNNTHVSQNQELSEILLATAMIKVMGSDGDYQNMRALIDQGSQTSLITENAAQRLGLQRQKCSGTISGVGTKESNCKGVLTIKCMSVKDNYTFDTDVYIMNSLVNNLPNCTFLKPSWTFMENIELADPKFNISRPVDILLGAEVYSQIIMEGICKTKETSTIAQQTRLGWILCGCSKTFQCNVVLNNVDEIRKFWEIEDITDEIAISAEDYHCLQFYKSTTKRREDGRYEVRLPMKPNFEEQLGSSKSKAIAQFRQLEQKFHKHEDIFQSYKTFIEEYQSLGHMTPCSAGNPTPPECYLPHHCVRNENSATTALRVVFNGSAKTSTGMSLNDLMYRGPDLLQNLQDLILKWRQYPIAFTADCEKMFRQIWMNEEDQKLLKIIWRNSSEQLIQEYQLTTVAYGTKAAPFLAIMTLKQLASDEKINYQQSEAPKSVEESFYMDDLLHGAFSLSEARKLQEDLISLLKSGGFNLRKWASNVPEVLHNQECTENKNQVQYDFKQPESTKTLGLSWSPKQDSFSFQAKLEASTKTPTKRTLLSEISRIFDPLGWLSPVTTKLKLLFQEVWIANITWDAELPENIKREWLMIRNELEKIKQFQVPRWLGTKKTSEIELHGFCDSSTKAYGCVIYCKINTNNETKITLVAGKARLVPASKTVSLPRLELCGADLLSKLMNKTKQCLSNFTIKTYGWIDSMVVLGWIQGDPDRWKPFVSNRVRKITEVMPSTCWRYVKSEQNPADCVSRGLTASKLKEHGLWWNGPNWLPAYQETSEENIQKYETDQEVKKAKQVHIVIQQDMTSQKSESSIIQEMLSNHSSFARVVRVLAWVKRFLSKNREQKPYLTVEELKKSKAAITKHVQSQEYCTEIKLLQENKQVPAKSKICNLKPFLDQEGILRVGGRLANANIEQDMKYPVIIPKQSRFTELLIDYAHKMTFHGGARLTSSFLRKKYWIVSGNNAVKKQIRRCVICRKHDPTKQQQLMGDLPKSRSNPSRPFYHTGVDFTGHIMIKASKGRGIKTTKGYVAVFVCMATKAVHFELVSDLSTSAFLSALRRMAARRGTPRHLHSDNGTNFIGANRTLQREYEELLTIFNEKFFKEISEMEITWHHQAPSWPSAGGLWEAAVKSLKYHLKRVIGEQRLTYEEFATLLAQLEACLNSRPLCPLSEDPDNMDYLTPSHFLTGGPILTLIETERDLRTRWQLTRKIFDDIWKRWQSEYLTQLQARSKWRKAKVNVKINDVVLIHEAYLPAGKWAMGRVVQLHPGQDGRVRVVTVKTKNGYLKRPIIKLSPLPVHGDENQEPEKENQTQESNKQDKQGKQTTRPTKPSVSFVTMVTSLLFFMTIITTTQSAYVVSSFKESQSLYFDKISNMKLIRDEWKVVVYYDMDPFWQGTEAFKKYIEHLEQICHKINSHMQCDVILLQLRHGYAELEYYNHLLLSQHNSARVRLSRQRRGLINGVGYVANSLFGVLDERFAEQYQKDIQLIRNNEKHMEQLWKNQTSVIEAEYNLLKRTEESIDKQHKILNQQLLAIQIAMQTVEKELGETTNVNEFTLGAIAAGNMLQNLKTIQGTLLDTITDIYHGKFNLHLLTPEQLREELSIISSQLARDISLPIDNIQTDLRSIYQLLKVKTRISADYLIFEIRLPLVGRDVFEILKIIPIPKQTENIMVTLVPIAQYIAINLKKDSYLTITENNIQSCLQHDTEMQLCYLQKPIFSLRRDENLCEMDQSLNLCQTKKTVCQNKWSETNNINHYFYFCCNSCQLRILCDEQVTALRLTHGGIVTIDSGCIIKSENFTVISHKMQTNQMNIRSDIADLPKIAPINHVINLSIPISNTNDFGLKFNQSLSEIGQQIKALKDAAVESDTISYHDVHHYSLIYILVSVVSITGVIWAWRRVRGFRCTWQTQPAQQDSAEAGRTAAATSSGTSLGQVINESVVQHKVRKVDSTTSPMTRKSKFVLKDTM